MTDQSESLAPTLGTTLQQPRRNRKLSLRVHRIDIKQGYIQVNKNQLDFTKLTPKIRYFFIELYKKCQLSHCLPQIFKRWREENISNVPPKSLAIKDEDALPLIAKMIKVLNRNEIARKVHYLKGKQEEKTIDLQECSSLRQKIGAKKQFLSQLLQKKGDSKEGEKIIVKLDKQLEQLSKTERIIESQRAQIVNRINSYDAMMEQKSSTLLNTTLNKTVNKIARNLIKQTILLVIEIQEKAAIEVDQVYVVFEQSYPTIRMRKNDLVRLISSEVYLEKLQRAKELILESKEKEEEQDVFCCHRCLEIIPSSGLKFCSKKITKKQTSSYISSDYYTYRMNVIESDYFTAANTQHVLPFFIYNRDQKGEQCCNRAFCKTCLEEFYKIDSNKPIQCPFCHGKCNCRRCEMAVSLVKCIAYDFELDPEEKRNYHQFLKVFTGIESKYVLEGLHLRRANLAKEFQFLTKSYAMSETIIPSVRVESKSQQEFIEQQIFGIPVQFDNLLLDDTEKIIDSIDGTQRNELVVEEPNFFNDANEQVVSWNNFTVYSSERQFQLNQVAR